jgi:hypothetical protein
VSICASALANESELPSLNCCVCRENQIPAPDCSTPKTRFWCRWCCEQIDRARHIANIRDIELPAEWPLIWGNAESNAHRISVALWLLKPRKSCEARGRK